MEGTAPHNSVARSLVLGLLNPLAIGIMCFSLLIIGGLWFSLESHMDHERQKAFDDVIRQNTNLVRVFEEHTVQTLDVLDGIVLDLVRRFDAEGEAFDLPGHWASLPINADLVINAIISDVSGVAVLGSTPPPTRVSLADREHVNTHYAADSGQLFIGKTIQARISGRWFIPLTRRANNPDGSLKGVVSVFVNPYYFTRLYEDVDLGRLRIVGLVGLDGMVRTRLAHDPVDFTLDLSNSELLRQAAMASQGSYITARTLYDGVATIFSYRKVQDYPLLVAVGVAVDEALAGIASHMLYQREIMAIASIVILAFAMVLIALAARVRRGFLEAEAAGQQLRDITDHLPVLIAHHDVERRYLFINKTGERWYAKPAKDILGKTSFDMYQSRDLTDTKTLLEQLSKGPIVRRRPITYPDGICRTVDTTIVPEKDRDGKLCGYYRLSTDVSARLHIDEQLREAQKMEAVGHLTGGIAHDFNNLLMVIIGNLEIAGNSADLPQGIASNLVTALKASLRGADLTGQLLSFGRRQALNPELTDLNIEIGEIASLIRRTIPESIAIDVLPHATPVFTIVDLGQLRNALLNLALNARDAMMNGGLLSFSTSTMELEADDTSGAEVMPAGSYGVIDVRDSGTGMPPEVMAKAFDPFFTTKPMGKGTGLGLSMVYGFLRQSGGYVRLFSTPGRGTQVRLLLKLAKNPALPLAEIQSRQMAGPSVAQRQILVVEDKDDVLETVRNMLTTFGYRVMTAVDGGSALRLLHENETIDGVIADIGLPGEMNGLELADRAVKIRPHLKIVTMSGYKDQTPATDGAIEKRQWPHLTKPFLHAELERVVGALFEKEASSRML